MGNIHSVLLIPNDDHADLVREGVCNSRPPTMTFGSQGFDAGYHWSCDWDGGGIRVPVNTPDTALVLVYECKPTGALSDLHSQFGEETDDDLFDRLRETWGSKCGFALKFLALSLEGYGRVIAIDAEGAEMVFAPDDRCSNCGHPRSDHHPGGLKMNDEYNPHEYGSILYCYQSSRMRGTGVTCGCMSFVEAPCEA